MSPFAELFPAAFPLLALAHFVALLSPGPDFFLLAGHAVRHRLRGSAYICVGIALGNAVYIAIAIAGWSGIRDNAPLFQLIELLGAGYLLWLGGQLIRSRSRSLALQAEPGAPLSATRQCLMGLASALLNPKNALFYMSLMTVILGSEVTLTQQIACGSWMFMAVLGWDLLVAGMIAHPRLQRLLDAKIHLIERGAGAVLLSYGIGLMLNAGPLA